MFDRDSFFVGVILPMTVFMIIIISIGLLFSWKSSCISAKLYNSQNDTSYTCSDFFWASEQINSQSQTINIK